MENALDNQNILCVNLTQKKVSSANYNMSTSTSFFLTLIPFSLFLCISCLTSPSNPSTTIKIKNGTNGSPCLSPLVIVNSFVGLLFTNMDIEVDSKQPLIPLIHLKKNLVFLTCSIKNPN